MLHLIESTWPWEIFRRYGTRALSHGHHCLCLILQLYLFVVFPHLAACALHSCYIQLSFFFLSSTLSHLIKQRYLAVVWQHYKNYVCSGPVFAQPSTAAMMMSAPLLCLSRTINTANSGAGHSLPPPRLGLRGVNLNHKVCWVLTVVGRFTQEVLPQPNTAQHKGGISGAAQPGCG